MDNQNDKLDALSARIDKAKTDADSKPESESASASASRVGFDFVGSVVGSGIVGAVIDHVFGTGPWWLVGMVLFGFGIGVFNAWRSMQGPEDKGAG